MIKLIKNISQSLSITRYYRVKNYIEDMEKQINIKTKKDKIRVEGIKPLIYKIINKLTHIARIEMAIYFILYFSLVSFLFTDSVVLSELALFISKIVSVVGSTIFVIMLFFTNKLKNLYYQDLNLLTAHLISIYSKHEDKKLEEDEEKDDIFIEFFKTRGF